MITAEQRARNLLERRGVANAQSMSDGELVELTNLIADHDQAMTLLAAARVYVKQAHEQAESLHDDPEGEYYMDSVQYEVMQETEELMKRIDNFGKLK
jgi:hypothetical protein